MDVGCGESLLLENFLLEKYVGRAGRGGGGCEAGLRNSLRNGPDTALPRHTQRGGVVAQRGHSAHTAPNSKFAFP